MIIKGRLTFSIFSLAKFKCDLRFKGMTTAFSSSNLMMPLVMSHNPSMSNRIGQAITFKIINMLEVIHIKEVFATIATDTNQ